MRKLILLAALLLFALPAQAGLSHKVGSFQSGTGAAASTVTVTGTGFPFKAIIFWTSFQPGVTATNNASFSIGLVTSQNASTIDNQRAAWVGCIQVDSSVCKSQNNAALAFHVFTGTATFSIAGSFTVTTIGSDGFTITIGTQFAADTTIYYEAWGGSDITNVAIGAMTQRITTGSFTETSIGFQPDFAMFVSTAAIANNTATAHAKLKIGVTDGTNSGLATAYCADAALASVCGTYMREAAAQNEILASMESNTSVNVRDSLTSVSGSSPYITLNCDEASGTPTAALIYVLAIKGGRWHVGNYTAATTATTFDVTDGPAWTPVGIGVIDPRADVQFTSDLGKAGMNFGFGASDGTNTMNAAMAAEDAIANNLQYWNGQSTSKINLQLLRGTGAVGMAADFTYFASTGWRGTVTTANASQIRGIYYSFAANASTYTPRHKVVIQ